MSTPPRGTCPVCKQERQLTKAGVMRYHRAKRTDRWYAALDCEGVGQPPTAIADDQIAAAEARGRQQMIDALRDVDGWRAFAGLHPQSLLIDRIDRFADYLEHVAKEHP